MGHVLMLLMASGNELSYFDVEVLDSNPFASTLCSVSLPQCYVLVKLPKKLNFMTNQQNP